MMFLRKMQRVIAFIRTMMGVATPTQPAGRVPQERTQPTGKVNSALVTKPRKSAPAKSKPSSKPKAAQSTKAASSRKAEPKPARKTSGQTGKQQATPASKTQSPVRTQPKLKQEVAPSTTVAAKLGKKRPTARQVAMVSRSKLTGSKSKTPV